MLSKQYLLRHLNKDHFSTSLKSNKENAQFYKVVRLGQSLQESHYFFKVHAQGKGKGKGKGRAQDTIGETSGSSSTTPTSVGGVELAFKAFLNKYLKKEEAIRDRAKASLLDSPLS